VRSLTIPEKVSGPSDGDTGHVRSGREIQKADIQRHRDIDDAPQNLFDHLVGAAG
jgi:hypothetical protein